MPSVLCVYPGCGEIVRDGTSKCEKHTSRDKKMKNKIREQNGGRANSHIYNSSRWRTLSRKKRTVNPFCEECEKEGVTKVADVVDHIIEISDDESKAFDWNNLKSLCHYHHNKKTAEEKRKRKQGK